MLPFTYGEDELFSNFDPKFLRFKAKRLVLTQTLFLYLF